MRIPVRGVSLNVEGAGDGPPLVLLHGFTGRAATWRPVVDSLGAGRRTVAVDLLGHGDADAPADPARYRMEECVADLIAVLDALDLARIDLLGYSMGGRVALHLAAAAPERVRALVLESGSPGLADPAERAARIRADEQLADRIEREGVAAFVRYWETLPLFASQLALPTAVRERLHQQRLDNRPQGLANSLRGLGTGRQASLWDRLVAIQTPMLLTVGALDPKYCDLARRMGALAPRAQVVIVPGAGHNVHLEQPAAFAAAVRDFLAAPESDTAVAPTVG
jgi:2-succinyl-6-hydroxy-2,4-cyclohexadiene-1-carboxylate synthase